MRPSAPLLAALVFVLLVGSLAALGARSGIGRDPHQDDLVDLPLDRIQHTITLPPDHNARITSYVDPVLHIRRKNEVELKRRLDLNRPKLMDILQATLSRYHVTNLGSEDAKKELAKELRTAVNSVLGGNFVEAVSAQMSTSR